MSMFDTLHTEHPQLICSQGHPLKVFQTKDFECLLDNYTIKDNQLFRTRDHYEADEEDSLPKEAITEPVNPTVMANVYTSCHRCTPVYTQQDSHNGRTWISEHLPWCEFEIFFKNGILEYIQEVRLETSEEVRQQALKTAGEKLLWAPNYRVLANDDPAVIKYLQNKKSND